MLLGLPGSPHHKMQHAVGISYFHVQPLSPFPSETAQMFLEPEWHLGITQGCFPLSRVPDSSCWWVWPCPKPAATKTPSGREVMEFSPPTCTACLAHG